jgi:hypothetical protein
MHQNALQEKLTDGVTFDENAYYRGGRYLVILIVLLIILI